MRRALVALSILLNLIFVAAAVGMQLNLHRLSRSYFVEPMQARYRSQFREFPLRRNDIVFLGDSLTGSFYWSEAFAGLPVRNRGIGGDTTADLLARLQPIIDAQPSRIFLMVGTNDLPAGIEHDATIDNYRQILERLRRGAPQTKVFAQSVLPRGAKFAERVRALNAAIAPMAREYGADYVDLHALFSDEAGAIRSEFSNDALHLHGSAYALWLSQVRKHIAGAKG